jgi:ABC-type transporter MlaC component
MKTKLRIFLALAIVLLAVSGAAAAPSDESEVRSAVQRIFDQLKDGQYEALYDSLPSSTKSRLARDRFVRGLQGSRNMYQLQRIEIGPPRISGDIAVVDTVMFARIQQPFNGDGKLVVQQYLVRENGNWQVATGDRATIDRFLKSNPAFARKFPIKKTRAFVQQDGKWLEIPLGGQRK